MVADAATFFFFSSRSLSLSFFIPFPPAILPAKGLHPLKARRSGVSIFTRNLERCEERKREREGKSNERSCRPRGIENLISYKFREGCSSLLLLLPVPSFKLVISAKLPQLRSSGRTRFYHSVVLFSSPYIFHLVRLRSAARARYHLDLNIKSYREHYINYRALRRGI